MFLYHSKDFVDFICDHYFFNYGGLKIVILVNFGQLTRDTIRAINV